MNWTEQVEPMTKMWNEAQKQFLGGWYSLANGMPGMSGIPGSHDMPGMPPGMPDLSNPMSWFMSGLPTWAKDNTTGQGMAGNLFSSQAMMMQSLGMLGQAWQAIAPNLGAGKPWQPDFDTFLKQWQEQVMGAPRRFSSAGTDMGGLMKSFMGEWGPLLKPWLASIQGTGLGGPLGDALGDVLGGQGSPLGKMFGKGMEPAFQDLAQIPIVGVGREQIAKITRAFDVHVDMRKASQKYQEAIAKTIGEAMKDTMAQLVELSQKGEQVKSVRDLIRIWVKIADRKFTQMYVSEDFVEIQREVSRANLQNKLAQRAVLEMVLNQLDIPTRTELDDAYKTLHNLKREVRALRGAVKLPQSGPIARAEAPKKPQPDAAPDAAKLQKAAERLEADMAALRDALKKVGTSPPAGPSASAGPAAVKAKENAAAPVEKKEPVKVTRKKVPPSKATS